MKAWRSARAMERPSHRQRSSDCSPSLGGDFDRGDESELGLVVPGRDDPRCEQALLPRNARVPRLDSKNLALCRVHRDDEVGGDAAALVLAERRAEIPEGRASDARGEDVLA